MRTKYFHKIKNIGLVLFGAWLLVSCESYLDQQPASETDETDVFTTYKDFQGWEDQMYNEIVDYFNFGIGTSPNMDDLNYRQNDNMVYEFQVGNYWWLYNQSDPKKRVNYLTGISNKGNGIWIASWKGIRIANMSLENMPLLVEATKEERELLLGQAYFFRAYFHWEIMRYWGGVPYVDRVFEASDDMRLTWEGTDRRPYFQEVVERLAADYDSAAKYLPVNWDYTQEGQSVTTPSQSPLRGRATKGAALAFKAKALLWAASPLMNKEAKGTAAFDIDLCKRAAEAAYGVIEIADAGEYELLPWSNFYDLFYTTKGHSLLSKEYIFGIAKPWRVNRDAMWNTMGGLHSNNRWNGKSDGLDAPTQNMVNLFETNLGLPIEDDASGYDENDPWVNRDPRMYKSILLDGTVWATNGKKIETFKGGLDYGERGSLTGYMCRKFWPQFWSFNMGEFRNYSLQAAKMRYADVLLVYAEAVNEAWGPQVLPEFSDGSTGISSLEAVNRVRNRVKFDDGTPFHNVAAKYTADKEIFRERIRNERTVELCFEGHRFDDIRRWYVAHTSEYRRLFGMEFDQEHTYYKSFIVTERVFDEKHYWLPFSKDLVSFYPGFKQNPGW